MQIDIRQHRVDRYVVDVHTIYIRHTYNWQNVDRQQIAEMQTAVRQAAYITQIDRKQTADRL